MQGGTIHTPDGRTIILKGRSLGMTTVARQQKLTEGGHMATPSPATGGYPKPTVGRIVHVHDHDGAGPTAAIVTAVYNDGNNIDCHAFPAKAWVRNARSIRHESVREPDQSYWRWPPRE